MPVVNHGNITSDLVLLTKMQCLSPFFMQLSFKALISKMFHKVVRSQFWPIFSKMPIHLRLTVDIPGRAVDNSGLQPCGWTVPSSHAGQLLLVLQGSQVTAAPPGKRLAPRPPEANVLQRFQQTTEHFQKHSGKTGTVCQMGTVWNQNKAGK